MEIKDRIKQLGRLRSSESLFDVEHIVNTGRSVVKELTAYGVLVRTAETAIHHGASLSGSPPATLV
jgi:hypothetical protein